MPRRRVYLALLYAPFYVVWKLVLWLGLAVQKKRRPTEWVRTARSAAQTSTLQPRPKVCTIDRLHIADRALDEGGTPPHE